MRPTVLVVEDDFCVRTLLARELRAHFEVLQAASVEEARAALDRHATVCAVLTDERLGDDSGRALLADVETLAPWCARVLLSAVPPDAPVPGVVVLSKPWRFGAVLTALERALAERPRAVPVDGAMNATLEIEAEMWTQGACEGVPVTVIA